MQTCSAQTREPQSLGDRDGCLQAQRPTRLGLWTLDAYVPPGPRWSPCSLDQLITTDGCNYRTRAGGSSLSRHEETCRRSRADVRRRCLACGCSEGMKG